MKEGVWKKRRVGDTLVVRVVTHQNLCPNSDSELFNFNSAKKFVVDSESTLDEFKKIAANTFNIPPENQRYWMFGIYRHTYRPCRAIHPSKEQIPLRRISIDPVLDVFLEFSACQCDPNDVLLFLKFFDPLTLSIQYFGHVVTQTSTKLASLMPKLNSLISQHPSTPLLVFEELESNLVDTCHPHFTFSELELRNAAILVFQNLLSADLSHNTRSTIPGYYRYLRNRRFVYFHKISDHKNSFFTLELSGEMFYEEVINTLASKLKVEPHMLQLTGFDSILGIPNRSPFKSPDDINSQLEDMLTEYGDTLYYEVLDTPLVETQILSNIQFYDYQTKVRKYLRLYRPPNTSVQNILDSIQNQVPLNSEHGSGRMRLLIISYPTIDSVVPATTPISEIYYYSTIFAEEIPKEESTMTDDHVRLHIVYMSRGWAFVLKPRSDPFFQVVLRNETIRDLKLRLVARLGEPFDEISHWRFAKVSNGEFEHFTDEQVLGNIHFQGTDYLGVEHEGR